MAKIGILLLADTESHGDMGRATNSFTTTLELKETGNEVKLFFDGAGTKWIAEAYKPDHPMGRLLKKLQSNGLIGGACAFCAAAFGVKEQVEKCQIKLLSEYMGHPSMGTLVSEGYQIITY